MTPIEIETMKYDLKATQKATSLLLDLAENKGWWTNVKYYPEHEMDKEHFVLESDGLRIVLYYFSAEESPHNHKENYSIFINDNGLDVTDLPIDTRLLKYAKDKVLSEFKYHRSKSRLTKCLGEVNENNL